MKIYKDKELKNEISSLDLGIGLAGESYSFEYYILNNSNANLTDISCEINNKEVIISSFPKEIKANSNDKLSIVWKPSIDIKEGLRATLNINYFELWS
jgi:hypothetical protein